MPRPKSPRTPCYHESENLVARALARQGWTLLARNLRIIGSELDIVACKGSTLAIVEVKARRVRPSCGFSAENLLPLRKRRALLRGATAFLARSQASFATVRFDLAVVHGAAPAIDYYVSVFD